MAKRKPKQPTNKLAGLVPVKTKYPAPPPAEEPLWVHLSWIQTTAAFLIGLPAAAARVEAEAKAARMMGRDPLSDPFVRFAREEYNRLWEDVVPCFQETMRYLLELAKNEWRRLADWAGDRLAKMQLDIAPALQPPMPDAGEAANQDDQPKDNGRPDTPEARTERLKALKDELRERLEYTRRLLETNYFPMPENIDDWKDLALVAGVPQKDVGDMTGADIVSAALAFVARERIKLKLLDEAKAGLSSGSHAAPPAAKGNTLTDESAGQQPAGTPTDGEIPTADTLVAGISAAIRSQMVGQVAEAARQGMLLPEPANKPNQGPAEPQGPAAMGGRSDPASPIEGPQFDDADLAILRLMAESAAEPGQVFKVAALAKAAGKRPDIDYLPRGKKAIGEHLGHLCRAGYICRDRDGRNIRFSSKGWTFAKEEGWTIRYAESQAGQQRDGKSDPQMTRK
jgi:hypothetical protein